MGNHHAVTSLGWSVKSTAMLHLVADNSLSFSGLTSMATAQGVLNGKRMQLPREVECPEFVKQLMYRCWNADPQERPDFGEIVDLLRGALEAAHFKGKLPQK